MSMAYTKTRSSRKRNRKRQDERRIEAADRLREYLKLSPQEKLAKLYNYQAKSQRARLEKEINGANA
jgi:hypothetical protein